MTHEPTSQRGLARHVIVDLGPARVERVWDRVSNQLESATPWRLARRPRGIWRGTLALALAVAAACATLFVEHRFLPKPGVPQHSAFEHALLETARDGLTFDLEDGSRIELAANTRVALLEGAEEGVVVEVHQGRVDCDVKPRPERRWAVFASGVEVRVTGTKFSVALASGAAADSEQQVEVAVERGSVEVTRPAHTTQRGGATLAPADKPAVERVHAGGRLSIRIPQPGLGGGDARAAAETPAATFSAEVNPIASAARTERSLDIPAAEAPRRQQVTAKELLDRGNAARRAGDSQAAASAYEAILSRHPSDPRAGLAAFELGRLRMDRMNDMPGAVRALKQAVVLAPGAGFREDAMARLVGAHSSLGAKRSCQAARQRYLVQYPQGIHAAAVRQYCQF